MSSGGKSPTGGWQKSPPKLVELFEEVVPGPPAETRKMFGYPAAFVNGNMFMGLHEHRFVLRLPDQARAQLLDAGATPFEPMPGRPMREYVVVPEPLLSQRAELDDWIARALEHAASLPAKAKRAPGGTRGRSAP
jgi:TfoX/Sxy family transcriptional regulator of competence genes